MGGCSRGVWQCQLGTCSPTIPPAPSLAAGSGGKAQPAFREYEPPRARGCDGVAPAASQGAILSITNGASKFLIFETLPCVHVHTHKEAHVATHVRTCTDVCTHKCAQEHTQAHVHTSMYVCTCIHTNARRNIHIPLHVHTHVRTSTHTNMHAYVCKHAYSYTCLCVGIHTHARICMHRCSHMCTLLQTHTHAIFSLATGTAQPPPARFHVCEIKRQSHARSCLTLSQKDNGNKISFGKMRRPPPPAPAPSPCR